MKFLAVNVFLEPDGYYAMTLVSDPFLMQIHEFSSQSNDIELHDVSNILHGDSESSARDLVNYFLSNQLCSVQLDLEFDTLIEALDHARQQAAEKSESRGPRPDIPADVHSEALHLDRALHYLSENVERAFLEINRSISRYANELQKFRNSLLQNLVDETPQGSDFYESSEYGSALALLDEQAEGNSVSPGSSNTKSVKSSSTSKTLEDIGLPAGLVRALRDAGITNVNQLKKTSDLDFMKIKGIGKSRLDLIKKAVGAIGSAKPRKQPAKRRENAGDAGKSISKGLRSDQRVERQASTYQIGNIYRGKVLSMQPHGKSGFIKCDSVNENIYFRRSQCSSNLKAKIDRGQLPRVQFRVVESTGKSGVEATSLKSIK